MAAELGDPFAGHPDGLAVLHAVEEAVRGLGPSGVRVSKSQVAFRHRRGFAYLWRPGQYLRGSEVPAVLSIALPRALSSPRFKEVVNPSPGVFMHHLEVRSVADVDGEVSGWLREAYEAAR